MDDIEPPSKRRKVDTPSEADSPEGTTTSETPKNAVTFAVEIPFGGGGNAGGSGTPTCGSKSGGEASRQQQQPKSKKSTPKSKERIIEHLDLRLLKFRPQEKELKTWMDIIDRKKKIIVIAGAGISVNAGIPDFRSATGLFASVKNDYGLKASGKQLFDASVYKDDKSTSSFHDMVRNLHAMSSEAMPTVFHHLLASLATSGRLLRLYTQNVDCIETSLQPLVTTTPLNNKGPWPKTVQLHGGLDKMNCSKCRAVKDFDPSIFIGPNPPDCPDCVDWELARGASGKRPQGIGKLRPRIVLYNEHNPDEDAIGAVSAADLKARPDCLIVVGTSLKIPGVQRLVRELCASIRDFRGGKTVWINREGPPATGQMKGLFDLIVKGDCETLAKFSNVKQHDQFTPECDLKKITGTGMELGVSTPISIDSDGDSPLSSPASYGSSEEIWDNMKNNRPADIPWPPKVVMNKRPLSPSASPHPKKATITKTSSKVVKKTKADVVSDKPKPTKITKTVPKKKVAVAKPTKPKTQVAKPRKNAAQKAQKPQKAQITKAFKAAKTGNAVPKSEKPTTPKKAATTDKPQVKVRITTGGDKPLRVSMETLKRKAEEKQAALSTPVQESKLVLWGSDSSLTDISPQPTPESSPLDPTRGMKIRDLIS